MPRPVRLRLRVRVAVVLLLLPLLGATVAAVVTLEDSLDRFDETVDEAIGDALPLADLQSEVLLLERAGLQAVSVPGPSSGRGYEEAKASVGVELDRLAQQDLTEEGMWVRAASAGVAEAVQLLDRGVEQPNSWTGEQQARVRAVVDDTTADLVQAERLSKADIVEEYDAARVTQRRAVAAVVVSAAVALLLAVLVATRLALSVLRPVDGLLAAVRRLGAGDLSTRVAPAGQDAEFVQLSEAFNAMAGDVQRSQAELAHQGLHDALTGLSNRVLLADRTQLALSRRARTGRQVGLLLIDLDGFKAVNDGLGHGAGDDVLRSCAERLRLCLRPEDTAARIGGDEFAVLVEADDPEEVRGVAERVLRSMRPHFTVAGREVYLTASVGVAVADTDGSSTPESLVRDADLAMYRAKGAGKDDVRVYDPSMQQAAEDRLRLGSELHGALERGELLLHYQPICGIQGGPVVAVEALMRWAHPVRGWVPPVEFIPLAEASGLINVLGGWALDEACRQLRAWQDDSDGPLAEDLSVSVNVSVRQLHDAQLATTVAGVLARHRIRPDRLILELTEGTMIQDIPTTVRRLHELKAVGVQLAIDDFGTGYSSLSYLQQFPIDRIKIDKSFVDQIHTPEGRALAEGVITLARSLTVEPIAEGIEHEHQRVALDELGCHLGQGYHFSRPQPPDSIAQHLHTTSQDSDPALG